MKQVLVISLTVMLGAGMAPTVDAHGYDSRVGGSFYWADNGYVIGLNYGAPYAVPYYVPPPRHVRSDRPYRYRHDYRTGKRHGYHKGYKKAYKKGYRKGYRKGHRHGHRGYDRRYHGDY